MLPYDQLSDAEKLDWLEHLLEHITDSVVLSDDRGRMLYVNPAWQRMTGYTAEEAIGRTSTALLRSDAHDDAFWDDLWQHLQSGQVWEGEIISRHKDGEPIRQITTVIPTTNEDGSIRRLIAVRRDISQLAAREGALRRSEERYALAARGANDGLWDWDLTGRQLYLSPRWHGQLGGAQEPSLGRPSDWLDLVHPDDLAGLQQAIDEHLQGETEALQWEYRTRARDGSWRWMLARGLAVRDQEGKPTRMAGSQTDVTAAKDAQRQLLHNALHDPLTGLANRALFMDRLAHAVTRLKRTPGQFAVLFIDLDRFKPVNDSSGHDTGDRLLRSVAARIRRVMRPSDTLARLGGDEFTVLVEDIDDEGAVSLAERLREALSEPYRLSTGRFSVGASIGVALGDAETTPDEVLRNADRAMYLAKQRGRGRSVLHDERQSGRLARRLMMERALGPAISHGEIEAWFQPVVSLLDGRILGFEALARWPTSGLGATPVEFVPLAEETGLISQLGHSIVEQACAFLKSWVAAAARPPELGVAVNLSPRQFNDERLVDELQGLTSESGVDPKLLKLEITESTAMGSPETAVQTCHRLRALGLSIAIDDFGTGYSSLGWLHRFPVQSLKIDRSFVGRLGIDRESRAIVRTVVGLAQTLDLRIVAEGVETQEQRRMLLELGCVRGQGWLFAAAEPAEVALARALRCEDEPFAAPSGF